MRARGHCLMLVQATCRGRAPDVVVLFVRLDGGEKPGDAKISDFQAILGCDNQILRFDIAMDNTGSVCITNPSAGLGDQGNSFVYSEDETFIPSFPYDGFQIRTGNVFHNDENAVFIKSKIVDGNDIGVGEVCS